MHSARKSYRTIFHLISKFSFFISVGFTFINPTSIYGDHHLRTSSAPYISGDTFRSFADHIFDETRQDFDPALVKYGDIIFIKRDMLNEFVEKKHTKISNPYVLLSHNSDEQAPGRFADLLNDPKILSWFAQNIENYYHPKLVNLPIGLANRYWGHGSIEKLENAISPAAKNPKKYLVYLNISTNSNPKDPKEREHVHDLFRDELYCLTAYSKPFEVYLNELASCKFVLSPRGNGIDTHRTWETLYLGSIPIVKTSSLDPMYEGLPVLIVQNFEDITERFLEEKYEEMSHTTYNLQRLNSSYWFSEMTKYKPQISNKPLVN